MPFTFAHTVAVIPLYKYLGKFGAFSALIIGSMTPDFSYLTSFLVHQRIDSHSLLGVYLYCIPMGLTIYFLFHLLMAPVLVSILPNVLKRHLHPDLFIGRLPDIPAYALILSIIIGALTHVFWDFFTHQSGLPQYFTWMDTPLTSIDGYDIMPYRVLQHSSTLFGLSLLVFWIWNWRLKKVKNERVDQKSEPKWSAPQSLKYLAIGLLISTSILAGLYNGYNHIPKNSSLYGIYSAQVFIRYAIVGAAGAFLLCSAGLGLLYQYRIWKT